MPITGIVGRNSTHIKNSGKSPAKIQTIEPQHQDPVVVYFDVVARAGAFADTTIANYSMWGGTGSLRRYVNRRFSEGLGRIEETAFLKGELTTKFESVSPKTIDFEIIYHADEDFSPAAIRLQVQKLQSLCYPRIAVGFNPPLCRLIILGLYNLEVYVQQVSVNWHDTWELCSGLPMGCNIQVSCLQHQYPLREEVIRGAGFRSDDVGGYTGTPEAAYGAAIKDLQDAEDMQSIPCSTQRKFFP
jgi:hypothetical protein